MSLTTSSVDGNASIGAEGFLALTRHTASISDWKFVLPIAVGSDLICLSRCVNVPASFTTVEVSLNIATASLQIPVFSIEKATPSDRQTSIGLTPLISSHHPIDADVSRPTRTSPRQ